MTAEMQNYESSARPARGEPIDFDPRVLYEQEDTRRHTVLPIDPNLADFDAAPLEISSAQYEAELEAVTAALDGLSVFSPLDSIADQLLGQASQQYAEAPVVIPPYAGAFISSCFYFYFDSILLISLRWWPEL